MGLCSNSRFWIWFVVYCLGFFYAKDIDRGRPRLQQRQISNLLSKDIGFGHSHNDFEQARPLVDALNHRFYSVEADIWLVRNRIMVSHWGVFFLGGLKELYLDPLQKRVQEFHSVFGDGKSFLLWLDIKDTHPNLIPTLQQLLKRYSMWDQKAVEIILTGEDVQKKLYVEKYPKGFACRDSFIVAEISGEVCWVSLQWSDYFKWNGRGRYPAQSGQEQKKFRKMVESIHRSSRRVRLWGGPDNPRVWQFAQSLGVDLFSTDHLDEFSDQFEPDKQ